MNVYFLPNDGNKIVAFVIERRAPRTLYFRRKGRLWAVRLGDLVVLQTSHGWYSLDPKALAEAAVRRIQEYASVRCSEILASVDAEPPAERSPDFDVGRLFGLKAATDVLRGEVRAIEERMELRVSQAGDRVDDIDLVHEDDDLVLLDSLQRTIHAIEAKAAIAP